MQRASWGVRGWRAAARWREIAGAQRGPLHGERSRARRLPRSQVRRQAEAALKQLGQHPDVVPALAQVLSSSQHAERRQMAGVLLRKRVGKHWAVLGQQVRWGGGWPGQARSH